MANDTTNNTAGNMTSRDLQAIKTKENVYNSALEVICKYGYENTSIKAITEAAGVSTGTFYTYFPSKDKLLLYTYEENERFAHDAYEVAKGLIFPESLFVFVKKFYELIESRGAEILRAIVNHMLSAEFKEKINDQQRSLYTCLTAIFEAAKKEGRLSENTDISHYNKQIFTILTGSEMYWCMKGFEGKLSELACENVKEMFYGMLSSTS